MTSITTLGPSPDDELDSDHLAESDAQWEAAEGFDGESKPNSPSDITNNKVSKSQAQTQKRRRVTRACDECRRKKIKCDGKQPCTHCTVYSYECTYDQPSNRRRNPAPQYIEALESRLHKAETIIRSVLPGIDLDDPKFDARGVEQLIASSKAVSPVERQPAQTKVEDDEHLRTMVNKTGSLDLDDQGRWDFHGHSSGYAFMHRLRSQFGDSFMLDSRLPAPHHTRNISRVLESPKSSMSSPHDFVTSANDLPPREVAIELCRNCIDDCFALMRPLHRPTFFRKLHKLYDTDPDQYTNDQTCFLPLLYAVMAVGCLFAKTEHETSMLDTKGYEEAMQQGYQYFDASRQMVEITDCRTLTSLQTITVMIVFLQSTAKLATCYAYLGIALRTCCRLGLHRTVTANFNTIEREERKRIFWLVRKLDGYVGAMLGLPQMLNDEDIDQELPAEVDDDFITEDGLQNMPPNLVPLIKATNAHTRLTDILKKVVRYVYPIKGPDGIHAGENYSISHHKIRELENDLQQWMDALPMELRPSENNSAELSRVQQLLRISYAHVQMMMYRPFIHYIAQASTVAQLDKRIYACAAACVSVARNIVHITTEMKKRGLLVGAYWFVMYTTYFAILTLVLFVLENPESPTGKEILKDAMEGRDTLASLAKRSFAADRCSRSLSSLFQELPEKLKERRTSLQSTPSANTAKKRPPPGPEPSHSQLSQAAPTGALPKDGRIGVSPTRARNLPNDFLARIAKRNSMPDSIIHSPLVSSSPAVQGPSVPSSNPLSYNGSSSGNSPSASQSEFGSSQIFGNPFANFPDLNGVMFPSDNPFAYPNQPISTLEDTQFMMTPDLAQDTFPMSSAGPNGEHDIFGGIPGNTFSPSTFIPNAGLTQHQQQQFARQAQQAQQARHLSMPMGGGGHPYSSVSQLEPGGVMGLAQQQQQPSQVEDYWTQLNKTGQGQLRSGLTPGGVNLDDLFGGEGWNNASVWGPGQVYGQQQ